MPNARGFPDWNKPFSFQFTQLENADLELAARRHHVYSNFVLGQVFYAWGMDDYDSAWTLDAYAGFPTYTYNVGSTVPYIGRYYQNLQVKGGDNVGVIILRTFVNPQAPRIGFGLFCRVLGQTDHYRFLRLECGWLGAAYQYEIGWDIQAGVVQYVDSGGSFQTLGPLTFVQDDTATWFMMAVVVDNAVGQYVRAVVGSEQWEIGEDGQAVSAVTFGDYVRPGMGCVLRSEELVSDAVSQFDGIVLTRNEA